jgi:hypothetical protein
MSTCPVCGHIVASTKTNGTTRSDMALSRRVFEVMASSGKGFAEASALVANSEPELVAGWKAENDALSER